MSIYWQGGQARVVARLGTHILGPANVSHPPGNVHTTIGSARMAAMVPLSVDGGMKSGFDIYEFEYNHPEMHNNTVLQGEALLSGGCPAVYDGRHCSELGFHYYPFFVHDATQTTTGNLTQTATYQWVAVYEWIDAYGVRHRSAPSIPLEVTLTGTNAQVSFDVATLQLTEHDDSEEHGWPVVIKIYRTTANGSVFYEMPAAFHSENDYHDALVTFTDTTADTSLAGQPTLYTSGSPPVLPNMQPPAAKHIVQHNRRVWLISRDDPTLIWISKIIQPGSDLAADMPGFPTEFVLRHEEGGDFTALASWVSNIVAFKNDGIYLVSGEPGDDTNQGATLSEPQTISLYAGCINPRSVVHTPAGLLFQARDTFWLLDRGFQVKKVGMPVEDLLGTYKRCTSAVVDPGNRVVLITMVNGSGVYLDSPSAGITLAWHYDSGEWTYWSFPGSDSTPLEPGLGGCMANRNIASHKYHQLQADGTVIYLDRATDHDGSTPVMEVSTPWLQFNGITGFQRVKRVQTRSTQHGENNMLVRFSYNHEVEPWFVTRSVALSGTRQVVFGDVYNFDYTDTFSLSMWFRTSVGGGDLIGKYTGGPTYRGWVIWNGGSNPGRIYFRMSNDVSTGNYYLLTSSRSDWDDGEWHHLVLVYSSGSAVMYFDGVLDSASESGTISATSQTAESLDVGYAITGNMCCVEVWDGTALTAANVAAMYASKRPSDSSSLSPDSTWLLGEGDTYPTAIDTGTSGFNGTMTNMGPEDIVLEVPSGINCVLYRSPEIVSSGELEQHYETHVPAGYQKSKAMRVIINTQNANTEGGANSPGNPRLENLIFTAGGKKGRFKLPDSNRG